VEVVDSVEVAVEVSVVAASLKKEDVLVVVSVDVRVEDSVVVEVVDSVEVAVEVSVDAAAFETVEDSVDVLVVVSVDVRVEDSVVVEVDDSVVVPLVVDVEVSVVVCVDVKVAYSGIKRSAEMAVSSVTCTLNSFARTRSTINGSPAPRKS
jgi:hypothetical protein